MELGLCVWSEPHPSLASIPGTGLQRLPHLQLPFILHRGISLPGTALQHLELPLHPPQGDFSPPGGWSVLPGGFGEDEGWGFAWLLCIQEHTREALSSGEQEVTET